MSEKFSPAQKAVITTFVKERVDARLKTLGITDIEAKCKEITEFHDGIFTGTDTELSVFDAIEEANKTIEAKKKSIDSLYEKVFGKKNEQGVLEGGLESELIKQKEARKALYEKIEGLLPGATTVGLAKAYEDHKKSFFLPNVMWSGVFIASMLFIIGVAFWSFKSVNSISEVFIGILSRIPFFFAATWLAVYASSQQSQNKRLEQEYAHKEALARSFEGYKRELEKLSEGEGTTDTLNKLMFNLVQMTGYNPSETLDKKHEGVKPPLLPSNIKV